MKPKAGKGKVSFKSAEQKVQKRLRIEEKGSEVEDGKVEKQEDSSILVPDAASGEEKQDSEVTMQDSELGVNNIVMAEPDSQARPEK